MILCLHNGILNLNHPRKILFFKCKYRNVFRYFQLFSKLIARSKVFEINVTAKDSTLFYFIIIFVRLFYFLDMHAIYVLLLLVLRYE